MLKVLLTLRESTGFRVNLSERSHPRGLPGAGLKNLQDLADAPKWFFSTFVGKECRPVKGEV